MKKGWFLSLEGSEGCGKSTQLARLREALETAGHEVVFVREPGGTPLGEQVRHLLQHAPEGEDMCPEAELLLFAASRAQLTRKIIEPALAAGKVVLADRFLDSTTVYQGYGRGLPLDAVGHVNWFATGGRLPDLTLLLDLPVQAGLARLDASGRSRDRMERASNEFFQRIRDGYLALAQAEPERFAVLDATAERDVVTADLLSTVRLRCHGLLP